MANELFNQLRNNILREAKEDMEKTEGIVPDATEEAQEKTEEMMQHAMSIPTNSLLYSLWKEWNQSVGGENPIEQITVSPGEEDQAEKDPDADISIETTEGEILPTSESEMPPASEDEILETAQEETATEEKVEEDLPLEIEFAPEDFEKIPFTDQEIEAEKGRLAMMLMIKSRMHFQATRPTEDNVTPDIDAEIFVHVSENKMAAWAFILPPSGNGNPPGEESFKMALMEYSVSEGLINEEIERLINEPEYFKLILIAFGKQPTEGKEGYVKENYQRELKRSFEEDDKGKLNYFNQVNVQEVHEGDVICELVLPVQGEDGVNVLGTPIKAKEIEAEKLPAGQNTTVSEDGLLLKASMDGHVLFRGGTFYVEPTFYVNGDVDLSVGNINFHGDVEVHGDVKDNFVIQAGGSVIIKGLVEGAVIEAGKDVSVAEGVLGNGKGVIKAGGDVRAEYIESSLILAGGSVLAGSIMGSEVFCDKNIECKVGRGTIIGGKLIAGGCINATIIGSRAERDTWISLGQTPYRDKKIEDITTEMKELQEELVVKEETLAKIDKIDPDELTPELTKVAADYRLKKSVIVMKITHLEKELETLTNEEVDKTVLCVNADTIFPVTEIHIMDQVIILHEKSTGYNRVHIEGDEIVTV